MSGSQLTSLPVVVLDPGHGGRTVEGGSSPNNAQGHNGLLEKNLTLDVANAARHNLDGVADVRMTRTTDVNLGLAARAAVARAAQASAFVSIHFNGAVRPDGTTNPDVNGSEAFIASNGNGDRRLLAQAVLDRVCAAANTRNRGVKTSELGTLLGNRHAPQTAATLVELSFLSNPAEADRLANAQYRADLGAAVGSGVRDYLARMSHAAALDEEYSLAPYAPVQPFDAIAAGQEFVHCPLLASQARGNNLGLRWNAMASLPSRMDIVLHLHGFVGKTTTYDVRRKTSVSGLDLRRRTRPTLALMPIGKPGVISGDNLTYEHPALFARRGQGFNDLIRWGLDRRGGSANAVAVGRRIYAAHSGGGERLLRLLRANHDPNELHLFDCFYQDPLSAIEWMRRHVRADAALLQGQDPSRWPALMAESGGALRMIITGRAPRQGTFTRSREVAQAIAETIRQIDDEPRRRFLSRYYRVEITPYKNTVPNPNHGAIPVAFGGQLLGDPSVDLTPAPTPLPLPMNGASRSHGYALQSATVPDPPLPARPSGALGGAAALRPYASDRTPPQRREWNAREDAMVAEIIRGNFPDQLRQWVDVPVQFTTRDGTVQRGVFRTMPNLLAIGSDQDHVIVPLDAISAQRVADAFECLLPTAKMVHDTYRAAGIKHVAIARDYWKTAPQKQSSTNAYIEHDRAIKTGTQRGTPPPGAVASLHEGHKKLVVIAPGLQRPDLRRRLAFYGFYRANGTPIQAGAVGRAAYAHEPGYADYSHGVRLVHPWMLVNGSPRRVAEVLADSVLHRLLSIEGPVTQPRVPATR